ncbi:nucleophile aminohydrolase [Usnea florida]
MPSGHPRRPNTGFSLHTIPSRETTFLTREVESPAVGRPVRPGDDAVGHNMDDNNIQYLAIQQNFSILAIDPNSPVSAITHLPRVFDLYSVALHAGTMKNWTWNPIAQGQTETYLKEICEAARNKLSNGAEAIDVAQFIVNMLEDHKKFNAGKGIAIKEAGGHELSWMDPVELTRPSLVLRALGTRSVLHKWRAEQLMQTENLGTVGAIARDVYGNLAAAGSTGDNTCKPLGRVGDTAIIGAGLIENC